MLNPISTYRVQFHKDFNFRDFSLVIPYLNQLGVRTIYASPIFQAVPGSTHGYDTVNPQYINPEIGTLEELKEIAKRLKKLNMSWIQDIVPNHMAFHPDNTWLMDVLEKGINSVYYDYFDINWSGDKNLPLMVPFLGETLEEAITSNELKLVNNDEKIWLKYKDTMWPVNSNVTSVDMPLKQAVDIQYYRLCRWNETNYQINFRRFFTVNGLICLNMQHQKVFEDYHELIKQLLDDDVFQGLRIDHIDGLYDPEEYFEKLRKLAGDHIYIIIEKILEEGEELPVSWPIQGSSGYDFLAQINNLFTNKKSLKKFTKFYERLTGDNKEIVKQITEKKAAILQDYMGGELDNLYHLFLELKLCKEKDISRLKPGALKEAIGQLLIHCPVYRFYGNQLPLSAENLSGLKDVFRAISQIKPLEDAVLILKKALLFDADQRDSDFHIRATQFYLRCMQFSGPLMAKGVEDTLMYTYNRFIGHNEVGDAPNAFGVKTKVIHNWMWKRQNEWSLSLNGSSTHDTKRGEDVRARLNVLSDLAVEWINTVSQWKVLNANLTEILDPGDEYFIYQTLIGSFPMPGMPEDNYGIRLQAYLEKALREGKRNSGWETPNLAYEEAAKEFALRLLNPAADFWKSFIPFHSKVSTFGIINSLSQLLLKFTCPGVPDVYQGTELWDLSLVDPDNRRPVDFKRQETWLKEIKASETFYLNELWEERFNGKIKLLLQHVLLDERKLNEKLFLAGSYIPLEIKGKYASNVFAFARKYGTEWIVVVVPRQLAGIVNEESLLSVDWKNTHLILPSDAPLKWENLLTGNSGEGEVLQLKDILSGFPMALLKMKNKENERSAGILMHITSLPSAYGIGDFGAEARAFIDFLCRSRQKYWQLLPLNPIHEDQAFSPYTSISSIAGNTLMISPDLLAADGLITDKQITKLKHSLKNELDFNKISKVKNELFAEAYQYFTALITSPLKDQFNDFLVRENPWLDDFSLFIVLKKQHSFLPWYKWEHEYRHCDPVALRKFRENNSDQIMFVKWQQFIFFRQWAALKRYAEMQGIKLYGDLPFYLGYDSVEVWSKREFFNVNKDGVMTGVAGVPPDYFNADGQLWGMPVYNWDKLKENGYKWWIERIRKNMELYDLLRLDHFRAFADYWEVPAHESTAINGEWKTGPGFDFINVLQKNFPDMPFVAEDLGKISDDVYLLRDNFKLAGMKVLQFAFGNDIAGSEHIPHRFVSDNFVVYTGTHDNNTTLGWYENESNPVERKHLSAYAGFKVTDKNVHIVLSRIAYGSTARIAILPMQDILGLGQEARMNKPATIVGNWAWRLTQLPSAKIEKMLREMVDIYGRG